MDEKSKKFALRVAIHCDLGRLGIDELEVVEKFTAGLVAGIDVYGHLDIDNDRRDFLAEAQEEGRDRLVYLIAEHLRLERMVKRA